MDETKSRHRTWDRSFKREHRMARNRLKDKEGDCFNAIFSAAGMNFAKLLSWLADLLHHILCGFLIVKEHHWWQSLVKIRLKKKVFQHRLS